MRLLSMKVCLNRRFSWVFVLVVIVAWITVSKTIVLLSAHTVPGDCNCDNQLGTYYIQAVQARNDTGAGQEVTTHQQYEPRMEPVSTPITTEAVKADTFPLKPEHIHLTRTLPTDKYLTIGVPSMYRTSTGNEYLKHTLRSLVRHIDPPERDDVTILIFLVDFDHELHAETKRYIETEYGQHLESGFMVIMEVDQSAYPQLDGLKRNYNDGPQRVKWRSKQVVDFAFMFYLGKDISKYYIQIEDDVISSMGLFKLIRKYITNYTKPWTTLDFASLGFIGKLYKSEDLERLAKFLIMFYSEQPVDWLYHYYYRLLTQNKKIVLQPSLFQHFGLQTSLDEKDVKKAKQLNTLKEKNFASPDPRDLAEVVLPKDKPAEKPKENIHPLSNNTTSRALIKPNNRGNPAANMYTSLEVYGTHYPFYAFVDSARNFFWASHARENATFTAVFVGTEHLTSVDILTGRANHPNDIIESAVLEYSTTEPDEGSNVCDDNTYRFIQEFSHGKLHVDKLDIPDVKCLRIRFTKDQEHWVVIASIRINRR